MVLYKFCCILCGDFQLFRAVHEKKSSSNCPHFDRAAKILCVFEAFKRELHGNVKAAKMVNCIMCKKIS